MPLQVLQTHNVNLGGRKKEEEEKKKKRYSLRRKGTKKNDHTNENSPHMFTG
jgi:hypothetical protein